MLHWFHTLRDPERKNRESQIQCGTTDKELLVSKASMESEKLELWTGREEKGNPSSELILKMEEFRTIMGYTISFSIETMIPIKIADRARKFYDEIMKIYRMKIH